MESCVFCRIARGELPSRKVYEDNEILAFHDIQPLASVHLLIIPKVHLESLADTDESHASMLGRMLALTGRIARENGSPDGYRTIVNTGRIGRQDVMHLHIHVLGGTKQLGRMIEPSH